MEAYQERVVKEKSELDERLCKLADFLWTAPFEVLPGPERHRLIEQAELMHQLSEVLGQRIAAFSDQPKAERTEDSDRRALIERISSLEKKLFDAYDEQQSWTYLLPGERQVLQSLLNARTRRLLHCINVATGPIVTGETP